MIVASFLKRIKNKLVHDILIETTANSYNYLRESFNDFFRNSTMYRYLGYALTVNSGTEELTACLGIKHRPCNTMCIHICLRI